MVKNDLSAIGRVPTHNSHNQNSHTPNSHTYPNSHTFWPHDNVTIMSGDSISHLRSFFQPNLYIFVIGLSEKQNPSIVPKSLSSNPLQCITVKKFGNPSESNVIQCSSTDGFNELKSILNSKAHSGLFIF